MFKGAKKEDLRLIALELNLAVEEKATMFEISDLIRNSDVYTKDSQSVKNIADLIIEERKAEEQSRIEIEKIKLERVKAELELAKLRVNTKPDSSGESETKNESLESLIKSIRTLTLKIPTKPEGWAFFFSSLERAFVLKNVPEKYKAEILLNLMGEKANHIITYLSDVDIINYNKVKEIVLREFQPTPFSCLEHFKKTTRQSNETHVQFASRLITNWEYYLNLRKVSDFETLKLLIVSDKMYQTLDKETASHISVRQGDTWFKPTELGKEIDLYFTSRGKTFTENSSSYFRNSNSKNMSKVFLSDVKNSKCVLCNQNHPLIKCPNYLRLSINERVEIVKRNNLCWNCLAENHRVTNCKAKYSCFCNKRHNRTLHFPKQEAPGRVSLNERNWTLNESLSEESTSEAGSAKHRKENNKSESLSTDAKEFIPSAVRGQINTNLFAGGSSFEKYKSNIVLLSTAICFVKDKRGIFQPLRAVLDVGAMGSFITKQCADRLNLKKEKINIEVSGINGSPLTISSRVDTTLSNEDGSFETNLNLLVTPQITDLIPSKPIQIDMQELSNIKLADDNFNVPRPIDLLLGAEIFYQLLKPGQIAYPNSKLMFQNTVFGYVASGSVPTITEGNVYCGLIKDNTDLNKSLEKFWELESVNLELPKNKENLICEEHYQNNYVRDVTGRYVVKMPLKEDPSCLGSSRDIALKKLNSLWNRLGKDPEYAAMYSDFLREYRELGHMIEINEKEEQKGSYYIPHIGVYRGVEKSSSTPLRIVFNASSLTAKGNSLNSIQYNGGVIQDDLFSIMLRFRKHIYAFTADIRKMYRMISIHPDQRRLQKILWKEAPEKPVKTFELTTVTYGTVSAPFLAMRTLKQLALDEGKNFPLAATVLQSDLYMDDVLSGSESLRTAKDLQHQLIEILKCGGMSLHKWCSNNSDLAVNDDTVYPFSNPAETSALGVSWESKKDCFVFRVKIESDLVITKRQVLSTISRIFDPLGLLGPVIAKAKIFMQKLWLLNLDWNDKLPSKEAEEWFNFSDALQSINVIKIERCILTAEVTIIELHGFADASEAAYGAVVYCKSRSESGEVTVKLVASKSRVSPIKRVTIPRLELCAAVLLAKLITRVLSSLKINVNEVFMWSDSMIVLSWLNKEPYLLKTFVANRVATIQELTSVQQWRHVPSSENPADLISRGVDPDKILQSDLWWRGPKFLIEDIYPDKQISETVIVNDFSNELKNSKDSNCILNLKVESFINDFLTLSNDYTKIVRILSYIYRFFRNCRSKSKKFGPLHYTEIREAETTLVKIVQQHEFKKEFTDLQKDGKVSTESKIKNLLPFLDDEGVLRVGGRLAHSNFNYDKKFPVILPRNHRLTILIAERYHKKHLHVGPQSLLFLLRQKFWPINGRNICRKISHECIVCFKAKPVTCHQVMGQLPPERVTPNFPFNCVGVDFCGPFLIRYPNQRKGVFNKVYICVFVCFVSKACHLEIVNNLSSDAFIATLKRFFSRRGKCAQLFSDNATNFVGSNLELGRLSKLVSQPDQNLGNFLSGESIEWNFIPPRAPNHGGLWEAGVKSVKYHLKRVVGNSKLTYEEFLTVIAQVEGILNSRPLYPLSSDLDDFDVLTPGHFLIGRPITTIAEPSILSVADNRLKSWQKLTKIVQTIWKNWTNNYLSTLQQRNKWFFVKDNAKLGDMVIIKEDNLAVCNWPLGRIIEVFPGKDQKVRVVAVKTKTGIFKRPISKICILPVSQEN